MCIRSIAQQSACTMPPSAVSIFMLRRTPLIETLAHSIDFFRHVRYNGALEIFHMYMYSYIWARPAPSPREHIPGYFKECCPCIY